jgi:non-ribosomal peptide synthetase component F
LILPVPRPFRDYIEWLGRRSMAADEAFWREALKGFTSPTPLPIEGTAAPDASRPVNAAAARRAIPSDVVARLRALGKERGVTLNTAVQAAWALLLARYSGQSDVVFGATRACRHTTIEGADAMVGLFINTLPVRLRVSEETTVAACLKDLRAQWIAMRDHEHAPLTEIAKWSDVRGERAIFNTIVVAENYNWKDALRDRGGAWKQREVEIFERTNFPLTLGVDLDQEITLLIHYDATRFAHAAIERMLGHLSVLLGGMAEGFEQRVDALPLLTQEEHEELVVRWNATEMDVPKGRPIHCLIEDQVERTPEAIAVMDADVTLTYRELNARANRIAHFLRRFGVVPGDRVGISMERSVLLAAGALGILKAGAAYVPLDPAYPAERLAFMVKDAGLSVILADDNASAAPV